MLVFLFRFKRVRMEIFIVCDDLVEARSGTVQNNIIKFIVCHLGIDIESINIIQVFSNSTCLFEITDLVQSPMWLIVGMIVFLDGVLDGFPGIIPMSATLPAFVLCSFSA